MRRAILIALAILLLALVIAEFRFLIVHLSQETGTSNSASRAYDLWSGFGSDLGEATLVVGVFTAGRHLNCRQRGCWRVSLHTMEDPETHVKYRVCHKHHPLIPDEHSHHGLFRNHFASDHLDEVRERVRAHHSRGAS